MWASPKHLRRSQGRSRCGDAGLHALAKRMGGRRALGSARKATGQWGLGVRGGIRVALAGAGGVAPERARGTDATGAANARRPCCNQCVVKYSPPATQNTGACSHWHGRRAEVLVVRVAVWVGPAGRRGGRVIAE